MKANEFRNLTTAELGHSLLAFKEHRLQTRQRDADSTSVRQGELTKL